MTKLDLVLERIRKLPQERQDAIAAEMELMLDHDGESLLTDEQWADLRLRMDQDQGPPIPHEDIVSEFLPKRSR